MKAVDYNRLKDDNITLLARCNSALRRAERIRLNTVAEICEILLVEFQLTVDDNVARSIAERYGLDIEALL